MPGRLALEGNASSNEYRLVKLAGDELESDRQAPFGESARQRDGGIASQIKRAGVSLELEDQVRLFAQRLYGVEAQRREGMYWSEQQIDSAKKGGNAATKIQASQQ